MSVDVAKNQVDKDLDTVMEDREECAEEGCTYKPDADVQMMQDNRKTNNFKQPKALNAQR